MRGSTRLTADDLRVGARFLRDLPGFLRSPISLEQARATVRRRFAARARRLVDLVNETFEARESPYARLMRHAGVGPADVAELVAREGVEATLSQLFRAGVYLTVEELKGNRSVVRGTLVFDCDRSAIVNPRAVVHGLAETSGSRGPRSPVPIDLASIADHAVNTQLALAAHGGAEWRHAHYGAPGGTAVRIRSSTRRRDGRPIAGSHRSSSPRRAEPALPRRIGGLATRQRARRRAATRTTLAPFADPAPIVRWLEREFSLGRTPHVWTFASSAVLVCQAASIREATCVAPGSPRVASPPPRPAERRSRPPAPSCFRGWGRPRPTSCLTPARRRPRRTTCTSSRIVSR